MATIKRSRPRPNRANIQLRERSGKYSFDLDRLCVCDHTFGQHTAEGSHLCIAHELPGGPSKPCFCQTFRPARS